MEELRKDIEKSKTKEELYNLLKNVPKGILLGLRTIILRKFNNLSG